jgi:hypothetical protein
MGLVLGHHRVSLSQGVEVVEMILIEFLKKIPLLEPFLEQYP